MRRIPFLTLVPILLFLASGCRGNEKSTFHGNKKNTPGSIHSSFSITSADLQALVTGLPDKIRETILDQPAMFLTELVPVLSETRELYILVDKNHSLPSGYYPTDLVALDDYPISVNKEGMQVRKLVIEQALAMAADAREAGVELLFSSAFRSYDYQARIYQWNVDTFGQEQADRESAQPGKSQHQIGTVFDFGSISDEFAETDQGKWMKEHAWEYGFSLSYPDGYEGLTGYRHESWHFRYITQAGALLERDFFGGIQQYMLEFLDLNWDYLIESLVEH
jgi:zinc D-Ala-D-Ala carboxypeptidase